MAKSFRNLALRRDAYEDAQQEAAVAALTTVEKYDPSRGGIKLNKQVARRSMDACIDHLKRQDRQIPFDGEILDRSITVARLREEPGNTRPIPSNPTRRDPFFTRSLEDLAADDARWKVERAARWEDIREGVETEASE